ncbi:helix-turn-helix domain-containing protein [bacterium]|nr:helix-turn-helix domain-containing protein [bacterium]
MLNKVVVKLFSGKYHNYELKTLETISEFFNCNICDILIKID